MECDLLFHVDLIDDSIIGQRFGQWSEGIIHSTAGTGVAGHAGIVLATATVPVHMYKDHA